MAISERNMHNLIHDMSNHVEHVDSYPAVMYVEATRGCPYSCIMCNVPVKYGRKSRDISRELLDKIQPYFKHLEVLAIHGDGEPLLSRNMDFFIRESLDNDCYLHMNTTGFFLNRRSSDKLCAARLSVRFSIHAGTNETYQRIMGNDFDRVIRNIGYLINRNTQMGDRDSDFWFSFIVMKENIDEIEDFLRVANQVGITKVRFMALIPSTETVLGVKREEGDFTFNYFEQFDSETKETFLERLPQIEDQARQLGITIEVGSMESAASLQRSSTMVANAAFARVFPEKRLFPLLKRKGDCMAPWTGQLRLFQDGIVKLCCSTNYSLGNLYEQSLDEIWNDEKVRKIRRDFAKGYFPRVCGYCNGIGPAEYPVDFFKTIPGIGVRTASV